MVPLLTPTHIHSPEETCGICILEAQWLALQLAAFAPNIKNRFGQDLNLHSKARKVKLDMAKTKWDWIYAKERIRLIHFWEKQENKIWESEHSAIDSDGHKSQVQFSASTVLSLFALHVFHGADWSSFCSPGVSGICKASFCCGDPCSGAGAVIRKPIDVTSQSIQYKSIIHNQKLT